MRISFLSIFFCTLLTVLGVTTVITPSQVRLRAGMLKSVLIGPVTEMGKRWKVFTEFLDRNLMSHIAGRELFIEINGLCQKIQGKNLVMDSGLVAIYKQPNTGNLIIPEKKAKNLPKIIENLSSFQLYLINQNIPFLVCIVPDKSSLIDVSFPKGYDFYGRENLDLFFSLAEKMSIRCLDLRNKINISSQYFKTDHHLKSTTAFVIAKDIVDWLRINNVIVSTTSYDPVAENYKEWITPCRFIGSWGKRVGELWSGDDDFLLMLPRFSNSFDVVGKDFHKSIVHRKGEFKTSILDTSVIESSDKYYNRWSVVLGHRDWAHVRIVNENNTVKGKMVFVQDSFGLGTMPYIAPTIKELVAVDLRSFKDGTITKLIENEKPDAVILVYNSEQLLVPSMFEF